MARRNDHSRKQIQDMAIQAAITILNREGVAGLSTRKVAKAIGYTAGTLYLVFKNLDELILHINAATLDELHKQLSAQLDSATTPPQVIKNMSLTYLHFAKVHYARWSLLFTHRLPADQSVPVWLDDKIRQLFELVGQPLKELLPKLDAQACMCAIRVLWSGVHGACELGLNDKLSLGGEVSTEKLIQSLVDNYLKGLVTQKGESC